jgi:hypothetical protein
MNYLAKNLNNSLALPSDIMKLIYEYADPLIDVRKQIETKDYDLNELMYQRMKKIVLKNPLEYDIDMDEILDKKYINTLYKDFYLLEYPKICGLYHPNIDFRKVLMIWDLQKANIYKSTNNNYDEYTMKNVYKKWLKL